MDKRSIALVHGEDSDLCRLHVTVPFQLRHRNFTLGPVKGLEIL